MSSVPDRQTVPDRLPPKAGSTRVVPLAHQLRQLIVCGEIAPGARLRLDDLRERFGVSLSPVREALSRLLAEGFVEGHENRGFRVADVSREGLGEITQLRARLETMALEEAVRKGDDAWEERLVAVFHRLGKLESQRLEERIEDWERAHRQFHMTLVSACGMPLLLQFCAVLHDQNDRYRRLFLERNPPQRNAAGEHKAILDAALVRDGARACALLRQHIERTGRNVQAEMPAQPHGRKKRTAA